MKKFILITIFVLLGTWSHAEQYFIVNIDNEVVSKTNYLPSQEDLDTRNEIAVKSDLDVSLRDAEYRNGKIVKHTETQSEKDAKIEKANKKAKKAADRASARTKLEALGLTKEEVDSFIK